MPDIGIAVLRMGLVEVVPASKLVEGLDAINRIYLAHSWLDEVEAGAAPGMFIKYNYNVATHRALGILRLEIGTPNLVELVGSAGPLVAVFTFVGGAAGIFAGVRYCAKTVKTVLEIQELRLKIALLKEQIAHARSSATSTEEISPDAGGLERRVRELELHIKPDDRAALKAVATDAPGTLYWFVQDYCREPDILIIRPSREAR